MSRKKHSAFVVRKLKRCRQKEKEVKLLDWFGKKETRQTARLREEYIKVQNINTKKSPFVQLTKLVNSS